MKRTVMTSPTYDAPAPTSTAAPDVRSVLRMLSLALAMAVMLAGQGVRHALADTVENQEKTLVPTLTLVVGKSDATTTGLWSKSTSASVGDVVAYHAEITLPSNLASFPSYSLWASGKLSEGLTYVADSVTCRILHADGTSDPVELTVSIDGDDLRVGSDDLLADVPGIVADDILMVEYRCTVNDAVAMGLEIGNENKLVAEYRKSPTDNETEQTVAATVNVHCFQIDICKVSETGAALADAGFVLRGADGAYRSSAGGWTKDKSNALVVKGDEDGVSRFAGLGAGTYELSEVQAPSGYEAIAQPVTVVLSVTQDDAGNRTLTATAKGSGAKVIAVDAASGVASVQVADPASETPDADTTGNTQPGDKPTDGTAPRGSASGSTPSTGDPLHPLLVGLLLAASAVLIAIGGLIRREHGSSGRDD